MKIKEHRSNDQLKLVHKSKVTSTIIIVNKTFTFEIGINLISMLQFNVTLKAENVWKEFERDQAQKLNNTNVCNNTVIRPKAVSTWVETLM